MEGVIVVQMDPAEIEVPVREFDAFVPNDEGFFLVSGEESCTLLVTADDPTEYVIGAKHAASA